MKIDNFSAHKAKKALLKLQDVTNSEKGKSEEKIDVVKLAQTLFKRKTEENNADKEE